MATKRKNWLMILNNFKKGKRKTKRIVLKNPGVASVTRCRLIADYGLAKESIVQNGSAIILHK